MFRAIGKICLALAVSVAWLVSPVWAGETNEDALDHLAHVARSGKPGEFERSVGRLGPGVVRAGLVSTRFHHFSAANRAALVLHAPWRALPWLVHAAAARDYPRARLALVTARSLLERLSPEWTVDRHLPDATLRELESIAGDLATTGDRLLDIRVLSLEVSCSLATLRATASPIPATLVDNKTPAPLLRAALELLPSPLSKQVRHRVARVLETTQKGSVALTAAGVLCEGSNRSLEPNHVRRVADLVGKDELAPALRIHAAQCLGPEWDRGQFLATIPASLRATARRVLQSK